MPQMAPMPWASLYLLFLVILFVVISVLYSSPLIKEAAVSLEKKVKQEHPWQW